MKLISESNSLFVVFKKPNGLFFCVREELLAFGNKVNKIYFSDSVELAQKFNLGTEKVNHNNYYEKIPKLVEEKCKELIPITIKMTKQFYIVPEKDKN